MRRWTLAARPHYRTQDIHRTPQASWQDQNHHLWRLANPFPQGRKFMTATAKIPSDATVNALPTQYHEAVISGHVRPKQFPSYTERIRAAINMIRVSEVKTARLAKLVSKSRELRVAQTTCDRTSRQCSPLQLNLAGVTTTPLP